MLEILGVILVLILNFNSKKRNALIRSVFHDFLEVALSEILPELQHRQVKLINISLEAKALISKHTSQACMQISHDSYLQS